MKKKLIGYIFSALGIIGLGITTFPQLKSQVALPTQIATLNPSTITLVSIALLVIGLFLIMKSYNSRQNSREVPILEGRNIVGYRRT
jgi:hypothetical protein